MSSEISEKIKQFYDTSSGLWETVWGEHMHHGYYGPDGQKQVERRQAQIDLIDELLNWTSEKLGKDVTENLSSFVDVGCGIGGSTLYLSQHCGARGTGITLSPVQAARAKERAAIAGLSCDFQVTDALNMPFADGSFDLVWSLESGEHMPDKQKFIQECDRVLKPGGTLILATWCHRPTDRTSGGPLNANEQKHLADLYRVYYLPYVISLPEYEAITHHCGLENIHTVDWSTAVAPFWKIVIGSAISPKAIFGLLRAGWPTIQGALALGLMSRGYKRGLIRYGVLCATKK
jgi:tocopherol O-methyltransferase